MAASDDGCSVSSPPPAAGTERPSSRGSADTRLTRGAHRTSLVPRINRFAERRQPLCLALTGGSPLFSSGVPQVATRPNPEVGLDPVGPPWPASWLSHELPHGCPTGVAGPRAVWRRARLAPPRAPSPRCLPHVALRPISILTRCDNACGLLMPLSARARLGPYEILAAIGAGGMGDVVQSSRHSPRLPRRPQGAAGRDRARPYAPARAGRQRPASAIRLMAASARSRPSREPSLRFRLDETSEEIR